MYAADSVCFQLRLLGIHHFSAGQLAYPYQYRDLYTWGILQSPGKSPVQAEKLTLHLHCTHL